MFRCVTVCIRHVARFSVARPRGAPLAWLAVASLGPNRRHPGPGVLSSSCAVVVRVYYTPALYTPDDSP